jgi:hypothetical protein
MRALCLLFLVSGCAGITPGVTRQVTRRVAFSTLPSAPSALSGSNGVALGLTALTGAPQPHEPGAGMAFSMFQPNLGASMKLGEHSYLGGKLALSSASFDARAPAGGASVPGSALALDFGVGGGHDIAFPSSVFGVSLSGEIGFAALTSSVVVEGEPGASYTQVNLQPMGRLAFGLFAEPETLRIYAGGTVGTTAINDSTGVRTTTCTTTDCNVTETGALGMGGVAMVGGGVRWQAHPICSLALEGWVPLTESGARLPFMVTFTVRFGDFVVKPGAPKPTLTPPPLPELPAEAGGGPV